MKRIAQFYSYRTLLVLVWLLMAASALAAPSVEVIEFSSRALKHNPLNDPVTRKVFVFSPSQACSNRFLPIVYYLPGYGSNGERFGKNAATWLKFTQKIADEVAPMRVVVVDACTRWGGSQYLNSPAQGNYADYICKEIVSRVESGHPLPATGIRRIIAGHSSGGFGALRLGISYQKIFDGVVALSPDSDFQVSHLPLVQVPGVTNVSLAQVRSYMGPDKPVPFPKDGDLIYALGLSAAYAPCGRFQPGKFEWLYDDKGKFREEVWQRWLDNDPLTIVRKNARAFRPAQSIYVEGAAQDEYKANIGARKIFEVLRERSSRCTFFEPPGKHGERMLERLQRGLAWSLEGPLPPQP